MLPELVIFDMDGTLTESKSTADAEMIELVKKLLEKTKVAVISSSDLPKFHEQFLISFLIDVSGFNNLYLAPRSGGALYAYQSVDWKKIFEDDAGAPTDKARGIEKLSKYLSIPISEMVFVSDSLLPGAADYVVIKTGIRTVPVAGPDDTKKIIRELLAG